MRVAVIGTGAMGAKHVQAWQTAGHEVVSVTDIAAPRAKEIADQYGVSQIFTDYREALSQDDVDIADVCLPLAFHAPVAIYAAEQGKHVFCEKPLARSLEEGEAMEEAVRRAGVQFGIGFQRNLSEGVRRLTEWAQSGKFGRPLLFSSELLQEIRPKRSMHDANGNMGPIVDACCHDFLMWQTVFQSKPKKVYARGGILAKDSPDLAQFAELAIDTAAIVIEYESGDIGEMTVSWGLPPGTQLKGWPDRIIGPLGGAVGKANIGAGRLMLYEGGSAQEFALPKQDLLAEEFRLFTAAIEQGKPSPAGIEEGRRMLVLSLAVLESIRSGEIIELDA
jgi:predicted dehydrogenase